MILVLSEVMIVIAFYLGYKIGSKEEIKTPIEKVKEIKQEHKENKENKKEIEKENKRNEIIDIMLENIDNYNGTGLGQKDIPYEEEEDDLWT